MTSWTNPRDPVRPDIATPAENTVLQHLRQRAETALQSYSAQPLQPGSATTVELALHELRVYQIELEIQNEELRRALAELDASKSRYFDLYDMAPVGYGTLNGTGMIKQVNLTMATLFGMPRGAFAKRPFSNFIFREDQDTYYLNRKKLTQFGQTLSCELRMINLHGTPFWVDLVMTLAQNKDGHAELRVVLNNISVRKQQEDQLHIQSLVLDQIQDHVTITDLDGVITYVNQAEARALNLSRDAMIGCHVSVYGNGTLADASQEEIVRETLAKGAWQGHVQNLMANGTHALRDLRTTLVKDKSGRPVALVGIGTDITQRHKLEMDLRQREQYQRALLDNFPFMVWLKDEASRFLAVNQTFASQYGGMDAQSMVGMSDDDIATPEFAQAYRADDLEVLRSGISKQVDELIDTGGRQEWFETYKSPIKVDGRAIGTVGFAHNITPRKLIEAELMAAKADAEQANRAKSRFLAAASHDLRQPLTALSLLVGLLKTRMTSDSAGVVSKIQICIDSLSELLTDLLDVSKLEAGVVKPNVSDIALDALLTNLVSVYAAEAEVKGLRLRTRQTHTVGRTDSQLLRRILGNLIANAIRYTDQGGVLVSCRRHQGKFWIEVWDTGIGIDADKTDIIFEEFRQLGDESRNRGSGLGLAIVAKAAALLRLKIRVQSRPGRGSLFAIEVPVGDPLQSHEVAPTEPVPRALRIGLVDDNTLVLNALTMALESEGHEVVATTTGTLLLEKLGGRRPDIVISDYRLADGVTGFEVITALRDCFTDALPVLLITGDTAPSLVRSMAERGIAVHYKPLNMDALCRAIRQATDVNPS